MAETLADRIMEHARFYAIDAMNYGLKDPRTHEARDELAALVDDLLARIRAAVKAERLAYREWYHMPIDGPTGPRNRAWQDARASLDALLGQEVTDG